MSATISCPAFVICQKISSSVEGLSLLGVSDTFACIRYPTRLYTACMLSLTGGRGRHKVSVWLTRSPMEETLLFKRTSSIDPVRVTDFAFSLVFPVREPGILFLTAKVDGYPVSDRRLRVYEPYGAGN